MSNISQEQRAKLQKLFEHGNKQMMIASFDYAADMFQECVLGDPGNVIYLKSFLENLKRKFADRKKKGFLSGFSAPSFKTKKPEQVYEAAVRGMTAFPWNAATAVALGKACDELGFEDAALTCFQHAVECDATDMDTNRALGTLLRRMRRFDESLAAWGRVRKAKPEDPEAIKAMKDIHVEKTIFKGGYEHGDAQQVRQAAAKSAAVPAGTGGEDVMGRPLTYEEQVERRIKKNPNDVANYIEFAQYYYQAGDFEKSEHYFLKVAELSGDKPEMVERLLDAQKQKLQAKAVRLKEEFEKSKTSELRDEFYKIKEELDAKNLELVRHRLAQYPTHSGYHFEHGMLLMQRGMFKEAIAEYQQAKSDATKGGECLLALGQCFQQIKQYKLAMTHYKEAVEAIKDTGDSKKRALYLTAKLALGLKEFDEAENYASQLAAIDFSYKDVGELLDKATQRDHN